MPRSRKACSPTSSSPTESPTVWKTKLGIELLLNIYAEEQQKIDTAGLQTFQLGKLHWTSSDELWELMITHHLLMTLTWSTPKKKNLASQYKDEIQWNVKFRSCMTEFPSWIRPGMCWIFQGNMFWQMYLRHRPEGCERFETGLRCCNAS